MGRSRKSEAKNLTTLGLNPTMPSATLRPLSLVLALGIATALLPFIAPPASAQLDCPPVPAIVEDQPESSFTGELLRREDGVGVFKVSSNPRDPKIEVFFGSEITYLTKGDTYRVRSTTSEAAATPSSNVSCGWTLTSDGSQVSTGRINLPESGLTTLALAAVLGLALAFGLVFILLAIKTGMWGIGRGVRSVATKRFT